jgi:hypothetical protein
VCGACNLSGSVGMCTPLPGPGAPPCASHFVCSGSTPSCPTTCSNDAVCAFGYFCSGGTCAPANLANGAPCASSAQCISGFCSSGGICAPGWDWSAQLTSSDVSAATTLNGVAYFFTDSSLNGLNLSTGLPIASPYVAGGAIENFPEVVPLADGKTYVFFTANDGYLYKVDATTLTLVSRLKLATAPDVLQGTPSIQVASYASTAFKSAWGGRDLVYVVTRHATDTTANQVLAVDAAAMTLPAVWQFTGSAGQPMDYASEGCAVDYARDLLYCGTNQPSGGTQSTLWAFSTVGGTLAWSVNAGSLHNRPQPANGLIYVADMTATLRAIDPAGSGAQKWSLALHPGAYVANNLWAEFRLGPTQVFVTDSTGIVYDVLDNGPNGTIKWQRSFGAAHAIALSAVAPTMGLEFVGLDDGTLHQLDIGTGNDIKHALVLRANAPTPGNLVVPPTMAIEGTATDINKLMTSSAGNFGTVAKQLAVPLP